MRLHTRTSLRVVVALTVLFLTGSTLEARAAERPERPPSAAAPRLAVVISVDGLSWDRLLAYRPVFTGPVILQRTPGRHTTKFFQLLCFLLIHDAFLSVFR